jgi:hypothetical protein
MARGINVPNRVRTRKAIWNATITTSRLGSVLIETYICAIADWKNVLSACKNQNLKNGYAIPEFAWRSRVSIYFIKRS